MFQREAGGDADYAEYMLRRCEREINDMTEDLSCFSYPDDCAPPPQEEQALAKLMARYDRWQEFRRHAKRLLATRRTR